MTIVASGAAPVFVSANDFSVEVSGHMIIGRDMQVADLHLPHPHVSRVHAEVQAGTQTTVTDRGSANGTFVNGVQIRKPTVLADGDRVDIGPYTLSFQDNRLTSSSRDNNVSLACQNLTHRVTDRSTGQALTILDNVSLVVKPKEFVCLLGPSGSGKSTLLSALSARVPASDGCVLLNGLDLYENFQSLKQDLAIVPQKDILHEELILEQALRYTGKLRLPPDTTDTELEEAVRTILATVGLEDRRLTCIRHLSGGQVKRASLANEVISRPSLLFLDEVTSGLDEQTDGEMMALFRQMANDGKTVICITHNLANVEKYSDLVVILASSGRLAFIGPPASALAYFKVPRLGDIYEVLQEQSPEYWRDMFVNSSWCSRYVDARLPVVQDTVTKSPTNTKAMILDAIPIVKRQTPLLLSRLWKIKLSDAKSMLMMGIQSLLVALLIIMVFGDVTDPDLSSATAATSSAAANGSSLPDPKLQIEADYSAKIIYLMVISCIWFGCNNAAKEIVKEREIYARERDVNLHYVSYLFSKLILLTAVSVLQATVLLFLVSWICRLPGSQFGQWFVLTAVTTSGVSLGLLISVISRTEEMAVALVPISLIPQMILAGLLAPLTGLTNLLGSLFVTSYWGYSGVASLLPEDLAEIVGTADESSWTALVMIAAHILACVIATGCVLHVENDRIKLKLITKPVSGD